MAFFDFIRSNKKTNTNLAPAVKTAGFSEVQTMKNGDMEAFSVANDYSIPYQDMYRTGNGYLFGVDGLFPQELNLLYYQSPLHGAIIDFKKLLIAGKGYTVLNDPEDIQQKILLNQLLNQFDESLLYITEDLLVHSRITFEVTWNKDFTKVIKLERLDPATVRPFELDEKMNPISFMYCWDWINWSRFPRREIPAFSTSNKTDRVQLYQYQIEGRGFKLYAEPTYRSALNWVILDSEMAQYHKANIMNSINPSLLIQYYQKAETKEQKIKITEDLNRSFAGARKTSRAMVTFSDGKDLAPKIEQMEANKLDKTFLQLTDTIQRQICYAHKIDPQLLGLKTPGSLGESGSFEYSFQVFNSVNIQPMQLQIEKVMNKFLAINGLGAKLKLNEPDIIDALPIKDVPAAKETLKKEGEEAAPETVVNEHLKNLTGKQQIHLDRILRKYDNGKLSKERAIILLRTSFGFSDEEIETLLGELE